MKPLYELYISTHLQFFKIFLWYLDESIIKICIQFLCKWYIYTYFIELQLWKFCYSKSDIFGNNINEIIFFISPFFGKTVHVLFFCYSSLSIHFFGGKNYSKYCLYDKWKFCMFVFCRWRKKQWRYWRRKPPEDEWDRLTQTFPDWESAVQII